MRGPSYLDGHFQSEDYGRFVLAEYRHKAAAVDHRDPSIEHIRHVAGSPVDRPDTGRDLYGKILFPPLNRKRPKLPSGGESGRVQDFAGATKCPLVFKWTLYTPVLRGFQAA